jgi:hypothetical protein
MLRHLMLYVALAACACNPAERAEHPHDPRVGAARFFTERYAHSRFSKWDIRATAAGHDCGVLLITTSQVMDDSLVEALHYGAGAYEVVEGGVQGFSRTRAFRGVVYSDPTKRFWTFGAVSKDEIDDEIGALMPCR